MLALTIMLVPTINLNAESYTTKDSVLISSNIHDFYNNYFNGSKSYKYFPYDCNSRTCYFGIDSENNYVRLYYTGDYSNNLTIQKGVDNNFSVNGVNIVEKDVQISYIVIRAIIFFCLIRLIMMMLGV